ncbi:MAG: UDP-2,3-diacylglucosamine diphosphatase [Muribaculaceae bacterium]|nr:UDP-2,3-diacylglucosamine diphosphatase [Muribaculaceae bacterium]
MKGRAEERRITYFVSDLHLGASYFMDPREHERKVAAWLRSIAPTARRLYLVGDVLDYWFEYRHVVPRGYVRFFGALAELADAGVEVTWVIGNHDIWIFDYLPTELGIRVVDGVVDTEIDGSRFVIAHGDGLGPVPWPERLMRAVFRNRLCQWLYAGLHPRWTVGFAYWWSASNRRKHHTGPTARPLPVGPLEQWVESRQAQNPQPPVDYYVFGHYHTVIDRPLCGSRLIVLGDWITNMSYGAFDGKEFRMHKVDFETRHSL